MISRGAATALAVLVTALVTACATPIAGTAQPVEPAGPPGGGLPLDPEQQRQAELFAEVRTWDMCAMHDIGAAASATGFAPDELLPYREPGICRLVMKDPNGTSEWELQLDVFPVVPTEGGGTPLHAGGLTMQQVRDDDEANCAYSLPIGSHGDRPWGIEMSVFSIAGNKAPCDVAREYATAIAPRMADPPLRSAGATSPALSLAASDPCSLAAAMMPTLSEGQALDAEDIEVGDLEPYKCAVTATLGDGVSAPEARGSVEFTMTPAEEVEAGTVAGFPAGRNQLGIFCEVTFAPSDTMLTGDPGLGAEVPTVVIIGECEQAEALAEAAAGAIAPAPGGGPREDALVLGDLDPPPTAESVDAPFDPCTVVDGWQAYPAEVQPPAPREPVPMPVGSDDPFAVGCKFNAGEMFSSLVWGMPAEAFSADPAVRPRAVPARFGDRPGAEERSTNDSNGQPTCFSAVQISRGIAAMVTSLPDNDPCAVNRAVLDQVAQRVS